MWKIKDENTIGGGKCVTPFGYISFETICYTDDEKIADYFKNKIGYTVTEIEAEEQ